ncbi:MAG: hypothetical protein D3926_12475 [Desulfobacteraceae bacterium]|nr:MAG: hypothetical protein D3926_12475 [Desulfobacteraceae bacterium]
MELAIEGIKHKIEQKYYHAVNDARIGAYTQELSALLFERYAFGLADATSYIFPDSDTKPLYEYISQLCIKINPEHQKRRLNDISSCAGICLTERTK